jgi:hypothetical protein
MFTLADLDTLAGQVTPHGVICLIALYVEDRQPEERLASICRMSIRTLREKVLSRLELHNYAATSGIFILITSKARDIIGRLLSAISTALRIQPPASADSGSLSATQDELPQTQTGSYDDAFVRAPRAQPHSDQITIIDQSSKEFDHDHDSEMNDVEHAETAPDAAEKRLLDIRDAIKYYGIRDLGPEKDYAAQLLRDPWITGRRIDAAMELAEARSNKPHGRIGLALHMLLKTERHREEIERLAIEIDQRPDAEE